MDQATILRDYKEFRRASITLNARLVELLDKDDFNAAASALGILRGTNTIELETEDELAVVMDYAVHNARRDGHNAVDRFLATDPFPEGSTELRLLRATRASHFTLFDVTTPIPGLGARGLDGPEKDPILLVDVGLSVTGVSGMVLATRIVSPVEGWWMTTGTALPLGETSAERVLREFESYARRHGGDEPPESERERLIRRACIAAGASRQIRYADADAAHAPRGAAPIARSSPKVGRNDACPCGSGKKYKKCCGD